MTVTSEFSTGTIAASVLRMAPITADRPAGRAAAVLVTVLTIVFGLLSLIVAPAAGAATAPLAIGTLGTNPDHAAEESAGGIKVAMMELNWSSYETSRGVYNVTYENQMKTRLAKLKAAGMKVTLGLGLHFTPAWVSSQPNGRFVAQDGTVSTEANLVFNNNLRIMAQEYFARANAALHFSDFWAVRVTSGAKSETLYPQGGKYWAFDVNAQNGANLPASMALNPFPGWLPGTAGLTAPQMTQWVDWYVGALADTARWQANAVRNYGFTGYIQVVTPGIGVLNSKIPSLVATNLPNGTLGAGAAWGILYSKMVGIPNIVAYDSSMADGSKNNTGCTAADATVALDSPATTNFSAAAWISRVADEYGFGKSGENPGLPAVTDPTRRAFYLDPSAQGMMAVTIAQAQSCGFQSIYWAHDDSIWTGLMPLSQPLAYTSPTFQAPANAPIG
jgi:hypothetical protein